MSTITKAVLTKVIFKEFNIKALEAKKEVNTFFARLSAEVLSRDSLLFSGFGRFNRKKKNERIALNPKTGKPATVTARTVITFSSSGKMRKALNGNYSSSIQPSVEMMYRDDFPRPKNNRSELVAKTIMTEISNALINGDRVEIREFGVFSVRDYPGYTGRNPKTGEKVKVGPKKLPFFKAGRELLRRANA